MSIQVRIFLVLMAALLPGRLALRGEEPGEKESTTRARTDQFGDPLPEGVLVRMGTVRWRHANGIGCLDFFPDGKKLFAVANSNLADGGGNTTHIWNVANGRELCRFQSHRGDSSHKSAALSADGKLLAVNQGDVVKILDSTTSEPIHTLGPIKGWESQSVAFSPNAKLLAAKGWDAGAGQSIKIWSLEGGRVLQHLKEGCFDPMVFSPDGRILVARGPRSLRFWDTATWKELPSSLEVSSLDIQSLAFSPDSKLLILAGKRLCIYETENWKKLCRIGERDYFNVAFSRDGRLLAAFRGNGSVSLWETATWKETRRLNAGGPLAFSPDGKLLATGGQTLHLWEVETGKELDHFEGHEWGVDQVAVSADGRTLVSIGGDLRLWETATGKELRRTQGDWHLYVGFTLAGRVMTCEREDQSRAFHFWDAATGAEKVTFRQPSKDLYWGAGSPDGKRVATGKADTIRIWEAATGMLIREFAGQGDFRAFSSDGKILATYGEQAIHVWEIDTGKEVKRFNLPNPDSFWWIRCAAFSPDGKTLACGGSRGDTSIRLLDIASGALLQQLQGHTRDVTFLAFSRDGKTLASCSEYDPVVRLWETATGKERGRLTGHRGGVSSAAFFPDGRRLASSSLDTTVLVWDLGSPENHALSASLSSSKLDELWTTLAGDDGPKAYRAVWTLTAAPRQAVPFLQEKLRTVESEDERISRSIRELDDDRFAVRERASRELERLGNRAKPALRAALANPSSLEVRRRIEKILEKPIEPTTFSEDWRIARTLEVLEHIATSEACQLLETLAKGAPERCLTQEAKASLARLARRAEKMP